MSPKSAATRWRERKREIIQRDGACLRCGSSEDLTVDHIQPKAKGGTNRRENLQTLCEDCNLAKGDRSVSYLPESYGIEAA